MLLSRALAMLVLATGIGCQSMGKPNATTVSVDTKRPSGAVESAALTFAWPVGASASVTEQVLKKGRRATTQYRLEIEAGEGEMLVFYRDFDFVALEGVDLREPSVRAELERLKRQVMASLPPYRVSYDGRWLGLADMETLLKTTATVLRKDEDDFVGMLDSPEMRAILDEKLRDVWRAWAEAWIGSELGPGERLEVETELSLGGRSIAIPTVFEHLGVVDGKVHLSATTILSGPRATEAMREVLVQFARGAADGSAALSQRQLDEALADMEVQRVAVAEALLDPETLLPAFASTVEHTTIVENGESHEQVEEHHWTFDWTLPAKPFANSATR